jgi:hydroxymethylpyrimidine pyrophosphatase-like HAD family hydrolase
MPEYSLAAIDLDGTLLRLDYTLSERSRQALALARESGVDVVFVTARHPSAITPYATELGLTGDAICCVGAAVCSFPSGQVKWSNAIEPAVAVKVARRLSVVFPRLSIGWVTQRGPLGYQHGYPAPLLLGESFHGDPADIDEPVLKLWLVGDELDGTVPDGLASLLVGLVDVAHVGVGFVDLVAPGADKVGTLASLCAHRGITPDQVVAFGDTRADLAMLRWAGHGVVMANADPSLHALADEVAPHCDDDGVAVVLERLCVKELSQS